MLDSYEQRNTQPECVEHFVKFVGGTTAVTKTYGPGVTVTYISTGIVDIAWQDNPGTFLGMTTGLHATTPTALKGYTITCGDFNTSTLKLRLNIFNSSFALADLAASQWAMIALKFKQTAV